MGYPVKTANRIEPWIKGLSPELRHSLWRLAVKTSRSFGRLTARIRVLPDYLILGTQRGGTTTLQKHLTRHPRIKSARFAKGVHFFDVNYQRGEMWYRSHFHTGSGRAIVGRPYPILTGEASPYYLYHPLAAERIAAVLERPRLIVVLRDPIERAFSHHQHEVARGFEDLSFEEALEAEPDRLAGEVERLMEDPGYVSHSHQHHSYLDRGMYHRQLAVYFEHFPRDQVFIADSADLFQRPAEVYSRLLDFLGVEQHRLSEFEHLNPAPRTSKIEPATRRFLEAYFEEPNRKLSEMLGAAPSWVTLSSPSDSEH